MNNDIIGKEVVFYENNTWNHIIKEINLYTYTIEYEIKSGFSDKIGYKQSVYDTVNGSKNHHDDRWKYKAQ